MKWAKMVVRVPVEMHVSFIVEPGRKRELMDDIRKAALKVPFESFCGGINGSYSMTRKVKGKHR